MIITSCVAHRARRARRRLRRSGRVAAVPAHRDGVEADGAITSSERPTPAISIAFALTKGDKPELVVQKLTELGVDRIVPFFAERSVVRWDDARAQRNVDRLRRVAREAAMQSRRLTLPVLDRCRQLWPASARKVSSRADRGGAPLSLDCPSIAIGPEGGWSDDERRSCPSSVALAATVLRAETAAIAAAAVLTAQRGRLGPNDPANRARW